MKKEKETKGDGVGNVWIALSKTKDGLLLSEIFESQMTNKQLFDYYKKKGYVIIDSNIFKVTNKSVLDAFKDAVSKYIQEKYNESVDWQNTLLSYQIVGDRVVAQSCWVQTKNGNEYEVTPNDLVNKKFAKGGGVGKLTEQDFKNKKIIESNGIKIELEKRTNPNYYIANYIDTNENEKISSYGSPYIEDVIYDIKTTKYAKGGGVGKKLTNIQLWNIIESANWSKDNDYERIKNKFSNISISKRTQLLNFINSLYNDLETKFGKKIKNISDDSWSDLKYEVIGRGRNFYNEITLSKLNEMNRKGDYTESFGYSIDFMAKGGAMSKKGYVVTLEATPNMDFETGKESRIRIQKKEVSVKSIEEAKNVVKKFINDNDLGGGNFKQADIFKDGKKIGYISYNNRVWSVDGNEMKYQNGGEVRSWTYSIGGL